jgi:hypothetical protein
VAPFTLLIFNWPFLIYVTYVTTSLLSFTFYSISLLQLYYHFSSTYLIIFEYLYFLYYLLYLTLSFLDFSLFTNHLLVPLFHYQLSLLHFYFFQSIPTLIHYSLRQYFAYYLLFVLVQESFQSSPLNENYFILCLFC